MAKLHILSGVLEGKTFDLIEERITLGRGLDNMIRLEDGTTSHHHALLIADGVDYVLRDLNSTNGTRVNGLRIVETKVHNGDNVRLGSVEMRFESDAKKASQPLPPVHTGVDLTQSGTAAARPTSFTSVSPFGSRAGNKRSLLVWLVVALGLVTLGLLVWLVLRFASVG
jgi:hypothetical protein